MDKIHNYSKSLQDWVNSVYQTLVDIVGGQGNPNLVLAVAYQLRRSIKGNCNMVLLLATSEGFTISFCPKFA